MVYSKRLVVTPSWKVIPVCNFFFSWLATYMLKNFIHYIVFKNVVNRVIDSLFFYLLFSLKAKDNRKGQLFLLSLFSVLNHLNPLLSSVSCMGQVMAYIVQIPVLTKESQAYLLLGCLIFYCYCLHRGESRHFCQNVEFDVHLVSLSQSLAVIFESCQFLCVYKAGGCASCLLGNCSCDLKGRKLDTQWW